LKTYYDIAGVAKSASYAEIKKADILCGKMMHPERFCQNSQNTEWEIANEMLKKIEPCLKSSQESF
jgi:DnaJ-class molecular chaperone